MAVNPTHPASRTAAQAAVATSASGVSALTALRVQPGKTPGDGDDTGGDFAAELQRAGRHNQDSSPDDSATATDDAQADRPVTQKAARGADDDAPPSAPDAATLQWAQAQLGPRPAPEPAAAKGPLGTLAKGVDALKKNALAFQAGTNGSDGAAGASTAAWGSVAGQGRAAGGAGADDASGVLGQGFGAANSATDSSASLAALLPQADGGLSVQAGAVGARPEAPLDAGAQAAQASPPTPTQASLGLSPQSPAFAPALGRQIEVWMRDGVQHAEVQLSPPDLGPIRVRIAVEGERTHVALQSDVAGTRDALQQALPQLSEALGQAGLSLAGGGVSDQSNPQSQGGFEFAQGDAGRTGLNARAGASGGDGGLGDLAAAAAAARPAGAARGLLDTYA